MGKRDKNDLIKQVILGARENSIGAVLFHQTVGQILGVNVTDMKGLDLITIKGSASPSQLAALTGLSTGATTAMIDRLEKAKLVERHPHPWDRRGTVIVLTKKAMEALPDLFQSMSRSMDTLVSRYSEKELKLLSDFFRQIVALWRDEREKLKP